MNDYKLLIQNAVLDPSFKKNVQSQLNNIRGLSIKTDAAQLTGLRESIQSQLKDIKVESISLPKIDDSAFTASINSTVSNTIKLFSNMNTLSLGFMNGGRLGIPYGYAL